MQNPAIFAWIGQYAANQSVAPSLGVEVSPINVHDAGKIDRAIAAIARSANGALIGTSGALVYVHR